MTKPADNEPRARYNNDSVSRLIPAMEGSFTSCQRKDAIAKVESGKRDDVSLREKVKEILRDINDGIDTIGKKMTVCQLYARQNSHRKNVKRSTEKGREYLMSVLKEDPLGSRSIDSVKLSDAKEWAIRMSEKGYAYKTISNHGGKSRADPGAGGPPPGLRRQRSGLPEVL